MLNFLFVCEYMIAMTMEIFLPCFYGSIVVRKSEELVRKIYNANWIDRSKEYRLSIRIMVQRSLRPIVPMAGGMFATSLPTFVSVSINNLLSDGTQRLSKCQWLINRYGLGYNGSKCFNIFNTLHMYLPIWRN